MMKKLLRTTLFAIAITLFASSVATVAFHAYGNLTSKSFLTDEQGFTDVKIGVYLAQDRCHPGQYFRYRFEATDHRTDGSTEKVAGEVCVGSNETDWFAGFSPLGHFAQEHRERKEAVTKDVLIATLTQLVIWLLLFLAGKEQKGGAFEK